MDTACAHRVEGTYGHRLGPRGRLAVAHRVEEQEIDERGLGELRCREKPPQTAVEAFGEIRDRRDEDVRRRAVGRAGLTDERQPTPAGSEVARLDHPRDLVGLLLDLVPASGPGVGERGEHRAERWQPVAVDRWEVGPAVEGSAVRRQEHAHRPPARPGDRLHRLHVDGVDVGAFLAVDLDADEGVVEHRRGRSGPRRTRGPSRGTSGRRSSRSRGRPAGLRSPPRRTLRHPTGTSRRDCRRAGAGTGRSRPRAGSRPDARGWSVSPFAHRRSGEDPPSLWPWSSDSTAGRPW